jgi:hypothetical protein
VPDPKEAKMRYKTIVLHLLEEQAEIYDRLRDQRKLLAAMNAYAAVLKHKHETWMGVLRPAQPRSDPNQISSEALELAVADLRVCLQRES